MRMRGSIPRLPTNAADLVYWESVALSARW